MDFPTVPARRHVRSAANTDPAPRTREHWPRSDYAIARGSTARLVLSYERVLKATGRQEHFSSNSRRSRAARREAIGDYRHPSEGWPNINTLNTAERPVQTRFRMIVGATLKSAEEA